MADRGRLPVYRIYLLTVWQEVGQSHTASRGWRFHLADPRTGKHYAFTNAVALFSILQRIDKDDRSADSSSESPSQDTS